MTVDHTPSDPNLPTTDRRLQQTLGLILSVVLGVSSAVATYYYLFSPYITDAAAASVIVLCALVGWLLMRQQRLDAATYVVTAGVIVAATIAVVSYGSLRTSGMMLYACAVAGAGIFTSRRAMLVITLITAGLICALGLAEIAGLMEPRYNPIRPAVIVTNVACIAVLAIMVSYSRHRNNQTLRRLSDELEARVRTERERDRSLDRFARIFHSNPSPMLAQSARNGMILDVNAAFERCYGHTREQVLGHSDHMLWEDPTQRETYVARLFQQRRIDRAQGRAKRADGSLFDAQMSSELSDDPDDRIVITTVIDITAQNEALERLRRSEERFAKAFNFSPLNMSITRISDGQVIEINSASDKVYGFPRDEARNRSTRELGLWADPGERAVFIERLRRDGRVAAHEVRLRHRDGHVFDARVWAESIDIDGEACVLACTLDVSEEKRREAQLLALTRGMSGPSGNALFQALTMHMAQSIGADHVAVAELDGSSGARTLAVWKNGQSAPNMHYELAGSPCARTMELPGIHVIGAGLATQFPDHPSVTQEGLNAYVGQSLRDEDGAPVGLIHAFWRQPVELADDARALVSIFASRANAELIRARREREIQHLNATLEGRVRQRTADLQKLNAELDTFAYTVSHDLKSPLRAIDGYAQLLKSSLDDRLDPDERRMLERVLASTGRMSKLIADLLALARISQGDLELRDVHLSRMVTDILQAEQARHPQRALRWRVEPGLFAHCDERLVRIALENLLGNAVKYTRDQASPLIEFGRTDAPDGGSSFFVRDNGAGFDMAHADKLFKPFERLHMPSSGFEGTGIGLATARRVVERHGGRIEGHAQPGQGAQFRFTLAAEAVVIQQTSSE